MKRGGALGARLGQPALEPQKPEKSASDEDSSSDT